MRLSGVSRVTRTSGRRSLSVTSAALATSEVETPLAMAPSVLIEQGATTMPMVRKLPDDTDAA